MWGSGCPRSSLSSGLRVFGTAQRWQDLEGLRISSEGLVWRPVSNVVLLMGEGLWWGAGQIGDTKHHRPAVCIYGNMTSSLCNFPEVPNEDNNTESALGRGHSMRWMG